MILKLAYWPVEFLYFSSYSLCCTSSFPFGSFSHSLSSLFTTASKFPHLLRCTCRYSLSLADIYFNLYQLAPHDPLFFIGHQLLDAAIHCEERGIFHRDIKSENIILDGTNEGVAKLTDFGLSSAVQDDPFYVFRGTLAIYTYITIRA